MNPFEHSVVDPLFAQKFSLLQQRILSLEISLQEAGKSGVVPAVEGQRRAYMDQISLLVHNQRRDKEEHDTGLPDLSRCTYEELRVINRMQNERLRFIKEIYYYLGKIFQWVLAGTRGHGAGFLGILRLSRMQNILRRLQQENTKMDLDDKSLLDNTKQLGKILLNRPEGERLHENFQAYMKLFHEVDNMAVRIQKMQNAMQRETREMTIIRDEIAAMEKNAAAHRPTFMPLLKQVEQLAYSARNKTFQPVHGDHDKLTLARHFVETKEKMRQSEKASQRKEKGGP